jgi:hypothetical protein
LEDFDDRRVRILFENKKLIYSTLSHAAERSHLAVVVVGVIVRGEDVNIVTLEVHLANAQSLKRTLFFHRL